MAFQKIIIIEYLKKSIQHVKNNMQDVLVIMNFMRDHHHVLVINVQVQATHVSSVNHFVQDLHVDF